METPEKTRLIQHIIRGQRTFGERASDKLTEYAGSWG